jgi:hypothetical protein
MIASHSLVLLSQRTESYLYVHSLVVALLGTKVEDSFKREFVADVIRKLEYADMICHIPRDHFFMISVDDLKPFLQVVMTVVLGKTSLFSIKSLFVFHLMLKNNNP